MGKVRIQFNEAAFDALLTEKVTPVIELRTKAVEEACTSESSWGGYYSAVTNDGDRVRGRVWSIARQDGKGGTERARRMVRNLDAQ